MSTLSKSSTTVTVQCDSEEEAVEVYDLIERSLAAREQGAKSPESSGRSVFRFSDRMPTDHRWFAFMDPEDPSRWEVGWMDWFRIRVEGGESYRHDDPRLTWWHPLPELPGESKEAAWQAAREALKNATYGALKKSSRSQDE